MNFNANKGAYKWLAAQVKYLHQAPAATQYYCNVRNKIEIVFYFVVSNKYYTTIYKDIFM